MPIYLRKGFFVSGFITRAIERSLLPLPDRAIWKEGQLSQVTLTTAEKVGHYVSNFFKFVLGLAFLPYGMVYSLGKYALYALKLGPKKEPLSTVIDPSALPEHFGFADSLFQTSGLGTRFSATPTKGNGVCDWEAFMNPERIEGIRSPEELRRFFIDVLSDPQPFINILKSMNATAHRFSLEWCVLQPKKGEYDLEAIRLYRNFFKLLKENGIEPYVTLHHFVCPEWFAKEGGFTKLENIETYKTHALRMMEIFPEIFNWMPFNEVNIDSFQKYIRGVYPPGIVGDMASSGRAMRNMLLAHCKLYKEAKARFPHLQIGSSHQWLNFEPMEHNPLEDEICYTLSKVSHYACYNFFKTGEFSLEVPGKANVQFTMPLEEFIAQKGFSDFVGVQFYGYPRLKAGFNGGHEYPGYKIKNFNFWKFGLTFGSTCPKGSEVMSFGPGANPESFEKCLKEAASLKKPIVISEMGYDACVQKHGEKSFKIDNESQRRGIEKLLPTLTKFKKQLKAVFFWTLYRKPDIQVAGQEDYGQLEWDRGATPSLGLVQILKDQNRKIIGHRMTPAAELIQSVFRTKQEWMRQPARQAI